MESLSLTLHMSMATRQRIGEAAGTEGRHLPLADTQPGQDLRLAMSRT